MSRKIHPAAALAAGILGAGAAALAVRAFLVEPANPELARDILPIPDLPRAWSGARLVHLSDLHYGDPRSDALFRWMVRTANALDPDLIVITGDFLLRRCEEAAPASRYIGELRARHGVFAVYGDHDFPRKHPHPVCDLVDGLAAAGVRLLRNESVVLPGGLRLAGVDPTTCKIEHADLALALAGLGGASPHILLSHSPDIIAEASDRGVPLVLCGHTHGGQVVVPGYGPPVTHTRVGRQHASGWSHRHSTRMYTSRGLASHLSLRFCCPPQITAFTLLPA